MFISVLKPKRLTNLDIKAPLNTNSAKIEDKIICITNPVNNADFYTKAKKIELNRLIKTGFCARLKEEVRRCF